MSRDFTYVGDIVDGIIKVIDKLSQNFNPNPDISSAPYRIYNAPVQLLDFIKTLESSIGIEAKKNMMEMLYLHMQIQVILIISLILSLLWV